MAVTLSSRFLNNGISLQSFCRPIWKNPIQGTYRTLYTIEALGLDQYEKGRNRAQTQFTGMADKFRSKMREFALTESKNMIFTEDLKNMLHLVENKPDDMMLVHQMMKRFNQQNKHLRFGNFVFGPVVMRMYHYLNEPTNALEAFKDPELEGMFDNMTTTQILCDLLYKNKMYQEILDVFNVVQTKQVHGMKFPKMIAILTMAACEKLNTAESYDFAIKILKDMDAVGHHPLRRTVTFAAQLALNQNAPQVALEILSLALHGSYVTVRNLKVVAMADLNRPDDAFPILRYSIETEGPGDNRKHTVCPDVLQKLSAVVQNSGNKDFILEFERIHKSLSESNQISTQTLRELLEVEIEKTVKPDQDNRGFKREAVEQSFRLGQSINLRPRRNPAFQRERQSIRDEY